MKATLIVAAAFAALLGITGEADARLSRSTAYLVALKDVQNQAPRAGATNDYSTPACRRISQRRVDCRVWIKGHDYKVGINGAYYRHTRCRWTVVVREKRIYPYVRVSRRGVKCRHWASNSPLG